MNLEPCGLAMEQSELLKALLERRREELQRHRDMHATMGRHDLPVTEVETSPADKATVRLLNDLVLEAADITSAHLTAIHHALAKFDDGSYGLCEECGNEIGFSRLQARPEATLCFACQTRAEKR
ncbi:MAG: TraR/DksA family transcriptional regulator [Gammaproteobacteria bacterium]